ncbi:MAG TPA: SRPBCC family protein [Ferruginibacter sp.]|nr:SRPBCC family protein [Ferruginibacter sp.]
MKLAKGFILALLGLFFMVTLISLLMPSKVMTARSVVIHAPADRVFAEIKDLRKWKDWHPVFMQDSNEIQYSNPSSGVNATATWMSNQKKNTFQITDTIQNQLTANLTREGEKDVANIIALAPVSDSNGVQVEWKVITPLKWYPWEKFSGIFIDKMTGPGYEAALNNLKILLEK